MMDLSSYAKACDFQPVCLFGLGVSGLSTLNALIKSGFPVTIWDDKEENRLKAQAAGAQIADLTAIDLSPFKFLLLSPGVPYTFEPHPVVINAQRYGIEIIGDLELFHRAGTGIKTIGITGTNGKSTTTALMTHILRSCGMRAVMGGNIGTPVMDLSVGGLDYLVLEMSSYQLDLCPTFRPDYSILLNVTPDHLDRHGDMMNYIKAKEIILDGLGYGIIGVDNDFTQETFKKFFERKQRDVHPLSVQQEIAEGFFVAQDILYENRKGESRKVFSLNDLPTLKGRHNYQNIAAAYAVAQKIGLKDQDILAALQTFEGLAHRQYVVGTAGQVAFVNDSKATNAEAAAKALSSYEDIFWIIGGRAKEGGLQGLEIFKDKIIKTYVIGEAAKEFALWLKEKEFPFKMCKTLDKAVKQASKDARKYSKKNKKDSVVLLSPACASWDQYQNFEKRGEHFMTLAQTIIEEAK